MPAVMVFAKLQDVHPQAAFVGAGAEIVFGEEALPGRLFIASRKGEAAVCAELEDEFVRGRDYLSRLAGRGELSAIADVEYQNGLAVVSRVWLRTRAGSSAWRCGVHPSHLDGECRSWWPAVTVASMSRQARSLPMPIADRPHGDGDAIQISIRGDVGAGRNTASRILAIMGNPRRIKRTIIVDIDSLGGRCDEGLRIYQALAEWPCAVYATIRRANSMAAFVALGADVRTIRPDGEMMIHPPAIDGDGRLERADLLNAANALARTTRQLAGVLALRLDMSIEDAEGWLAKETTFNAGEALACGLVHEIRAEDVPAAPRRVRAAFAPIRGPYTVLR